MEENFNPTQQLTPTVFHILMALADGEKHGYSIMKDVEKQTNGKIKLGPGTLYGSIKRMLAANLIEEADEHSDPAMDDQQRRYYRMSGIGQTILNAKGRHLDQTVNTCSQKRIWVCG
jgi:DNA-binding PadR family transcriptional regulator